MRVSEEQYSQLTKDRGNALSSNPAVRPRPRHAPGRMNKTEAAYAQYLEARKHLKEIVRWAYEPIKFKLADKTYYTPDFLVTFTDHMEIHEVKGFMQEDANVKIKVVAEMFPEFAFIVVKKQKDGWVYREV